MSVSPWCLRSALLAVALAVTSVRAQEPVVTRDVAVPMSDGVSLLADVYRPVGGEPAPAIVIRTPYHRRGKEFLGKAFSARGYAVVIQDVRGMNGSGGTFVPFVHEKRDGRETLEWVAAQSWCNGRLGMWGSSYLSYCALIAAAQGRPRLEAIVNFSGWGDSSQVVMPGGSLHLMCAVPWTLSSQIHGRGRFQDYDWHKAFRHLPVRDIPQSLGVQSGAWEGMLALLTGESLSTDANALDAWKGCPPATLHVTGWYDFLSPFALDVYERFTESKCAGGDAIVQRLVVGPWRHDQHWLDDARVGDEDFGASAVFGVERVIELSLDWFDAQLKQPAAKPGASKPVRLFVMGENQWREFDAWPPRGATMQKWFIQSEQGANGLHGDGSLSTEAPAGDGADRFTYDPDDPIPTTGGANFHFFLDNLGVRDQRQLEQRDDVLVYTSAPVDKDVSIVGPLQAVVYAKTTGRHADFTAKLVEVRPDGYAAILADGIKHGPDAGKHPSAGTGVEPGRVYPYTIDLGATAIRLRQGHRVRLEISSSNFPKYVRNSGGEDDPLTATTLARTEQTVMHSQEHPTHIVLPVLIEP